MAMKVRQVKSIMRRRWDVALRNWVASMAYSPIFECHLQHAPVIDRRKPALRSDAIKTSKEAVQTELAGPPRPSSIAREEP